MFELIPALSLGHLGGSQFNVWITHYIEKWAMIPASASPKLVQGFGYPLCWVDPSTGSQFNVWVTHYIEI